MISFTVSAIQDGLVSNHLVYSTQPGDYLTLEQPAGDFHLPTDRNTPMLFITGGSGITPAMGMIRTLIGAGECHDVVLMHHAPSADETIFADELAELAARTPGLTVNVAHTGAGAPPPSWRSPPSVSTGSVPTGAPAPHGHVARHRC